MLSLAQNQTHWTEVQKYLHNTNQWNVWMINCRRSVVEQKILDLLGTSVLIISQQDSILGGLVDQSYALSQVTYHSLKAGYRDEPIQCRCCISLSKCWEGQVAVVNGVTHTVLNDTFYSFTCLSEQTTKFFSYRKRLFLVTEFNYLWLYLELNGRSQTALFILRSQEQNFMSLICVCL